MADLENSVKQSDQRIKDIPRSKNAIIGTATMNLVRFSKRVHLISSKQPRRVHPQPQEPQLKPTKLEDTPATAVTVVPRKKAIRKMSADEHTMHKPSKPISIRAKKSAK